MMKMFFWLWISLTFSSLFYPRHSLLSPSGDLEPILFWNGPDSSPLCNVHFEFISSQTLDCGKQFFFFKLTRIRFLYINVTKILVFHNFVLFQLHFLILFILTDGNFDMIFCSWSKRRRFFYNSPRGQLSCEQTLQSDGFAYSSNPCSFNSCEKPEHPGWW